MAQIVAGMASSHAFALMDPADWEQGRAHNRALYGKLYGGEPPEQPRVATETAEDIRTRYANVRATLDHLQAVMATKRPDALLLIGDDQRENFTEENLPQFAIYTGEQVKTAGRQGDGRTYRCHAELAEAVLESCVEQGIDLSFSRRFPDEELKSHAHTPLLPMLALEAQIPVVPMFVNALHHPAPEPARCYAFGQAIRRALEARPPDERVVLYASGGLSHFTAGYPWKQYRGPHAYGAISEEFDHQILQWMRQGKGSQCTSLTSRDLLDHGDIEFRSWIIMLGAVGDTPATELTYEPFYRGIMGMGVGYWDLENGRST
jgi:aromatic ring-opening dioxygenase LigB subunit